jgi:prolyl oligopeptidase
MQAGLAMLPSRYRHDGLPIAGASSPNRPWSERVIGPPWGPLGQWLKAKIAGMAGRGALRAGGGNSEPPPRPDGAAATPSGDTRSAALAGHQAALADLCRLIDRCHVEPAQTLAAPLSAAVDAACAGGIEALGWNETQVQTFRRFHASDVLLEAAGASQSATLPPARASDRVWPSPPQVDMRPEVRFSADNLACRIDPYAWLESNGPDTQAFVQAQRQYHADVLGEIPGYDTLRAAFAAIKARSPDRICQVRETAQGVFYLNRCCSDSREVLYLRTHDAPADDHGRMLFDPRSLGDDMALSTYRPSPSGRYVALSVGASDENHVIRILDLEHGELLPDELPRAWHGLEDWLDDDHLLYRQLPPLAPGTPSSDIRLNAYLTLHRVDTPASADVPVYGPGIRTDIDVAANEAPEAQVMGEYVFADGQQAETRAGKILYYTRRDTLVAAATGVAAGAPAEAAAAPWQPLAARADGIRDYAVHGDDIYLATFRGRDGQMASHFRVIRTSLSAPDLAQAEEVLPEQHDAVVVGVRAARDALYVHLSWVDGDQLLRLGFDSAEPQALDLPFRGFISNLHADVARPELTFTLQSPIASPRAMRIADRHAAPADTGLQRPHPDDPVQGLTWETIWGPSEDGTPIPISVVRRVGEGGPTRLHAYGAAETFPLYRIGATFEPEVLHLVRTYGLVDAQAYPRGSGMLGQAWYLAGVGPNKPIGWQDVHAAAGALQEAGIAEFDQIVAEFASAGGRLAPAVALRPDRFAGMILSFAVLDGLAKQDNPTRVFNGPEYAGTAQTAAGFVATASIHAYNRLTPTAHPRTLALTSPGDARVQAGMTYKYVARAQAATLGTEPIMMYVGDGGHMSHTHTLAVERLLQKASFVLRTGGHPAFQPQSS